MSLGRLHFAKRIILAVFSLLILASMTSCDSLIEDLYEAYNSATESETAYTETSQTSETFESLEPTGSYDDATYETKTLTYDYLKSIYIHSVWYDVETSNPAKINNIATEKAFAVKGVFYFSEPLYTSFEARLYKGDEVVLTKTVNMYDNVTCEVDFSAGLEGLGTFEPGEYKISLLFEGKEIATTTNLKVI